MKSQQYVKSLEIKGQKMIQRDYIIIKSCLHKVFSDKNLNKKLDITNWPSGKNNDRADESIKTLLYLFKKIYSTYVNCNDKKLRCMYCNAIDKYIQLIKLAHRVCCNIKTLEIIRYLLSKLKIIQRLGICKCKLHIKYFKLNKKHKKHKNKNKNNNNNNKDKLIDTEKINTDTITNISAELKSILLRVQENTIAETIKNDNIQEKQEISEFVCNKSIDTNNTALIDMYKNISDLKNKYNISDNELQNNDIKSSFSSIIPLIQGIMTKLDSVEDSCKTTTLISELANGVFNTYDFKQDASQNYPSNESQTPISVTINNVYPKSLKGYKLSGIVCYCLQCKKVINDTVNNDSMAINTNDTSQGFPVVCCKCYISALNKYK